MSRSGSAKKAKPKKRSAPAGCAPEQILLGHPPEVVVIAEALRRYVREVLPDVVEIGYPGWKIIGYRADAYIGFIQPQGDHVRLGFERGIYLDDPDGVLEGDGTQIRYVVVSSARFAKTPIRRLLLAAVALSAVPAEMLSRRS